LRTSEPASGVAPRWAKAPTLPLRQRVRAPARERPPKIKVERRDRREVKTVQALHCREPRLLDAALDHAPFPVDQFEFGQAQQITRVVDALGGALLGASSRRRHRALAARRGTPPDPAPAVRRSSGRDRVADPRTGADNPRAADHGEHCHIRDILRKGTPPFRDGFQTSRRSLEANRTAANGEVLGLVVTGCVDYGFVAIPGDRCCAIDFLGNDVPAADLRVTLYPFGGFYAD
jgi:hypothetical protein